LLTNPFLAFLAKNCYSLQENIETLRNLRKAELQVALGQKASSYFDGVKAKTKVGDAPLDNWTQLFNDLEALQLPQDDHERAQEVLRESLLDHTGLQFQFEKEILSAYADWFAFRIYYNGYKRDPSVQQFIDAIRQVEVDPDDLVKA
jgi:hypothetical protein